MLLFHSSLFALFSQSCQFQCENLTTSSHSGTNSLCVCRQRHWFFFSLFAFHFNVLIAQVEWQKTTKRNVNMYEEDVIFAHRIFMHFSIQSWVSLIVTASWKEQLLIWFEKFEMFECLHLQFVSSYIQTRVSSKSRISNSFSLQFHPVMCKCRTNIMLSSSQNVKLCVLTSVRYDFQSQFSFCISGLKQSRCRNVFPYQKSQ